VLAHKAIPRALELAGSALGRDVEWEWHPTRSIGAASVDSFKAFHGMWCVPGSPYESEAGAIEAIRFARVSGIPYLGTCGGCQHAILEFARSVLGLRNAEHAESNPSALLPLIAPMACALVEKSAPILLEPGTRVREIYGKEEIEEGYHCSFGLNQELEHLLAGSALRISGRDPGGEARALELEGHPFFLLTQFQPERRALAGSAPPLVSAFLEHAARQRD
jgi:CTP synthase (UTP-ammonia lyase)